MVRRMVEAPGVCPRPMCSRTFARTRPAHVCVHAWISWIFIMLNDMAHNIPCATHNILGRSRIASEIHANTYTMCTIMMAAVVAHSLSHAWALCSPGLCEFYVQHTCNVRACVHIAKSCQQRNRTRAASTRTNARTHASRTRTASA